MRRSLVVGAASAAALVLLVELWTDAPQGALAQPPARPAAKPTPQASPEQIKAGQAAFTQIALVLQSPRCQNCHPAGDRPLQTDLGVPHAMNISRKSVEAGLKCSTCHREQNATTPGGPPGAPHWQLPAAQTPMIFEGLSESALCEQLRDPDRNGQRSLAELLEHVTHDRLVLWGWSPGPGRTLPPLTHAQFVTHFTTWVNAGGPCSPATPTPSTPKTP